MAATGAEFTEKNGAPEIDLNGEAEGTDTRIKYAENSPATAIAPDAFVNDDTEYFDGATLIVEFKDRSTTDDQLQIVGGPFGESPIYAIETDLYYKDEIIGSITGGTDGSTPLLISFSGKVTTDIVQAVIRSIGYANFSQDPGEGERYVTFTLVDREGIASRAAIASIYVSASDSPAVAEDDTVSTTEDEVGYGSLFDPNGPGNDYDPDGGKLTIAAVNGSEKNVGQTIKLESGALLTVSEDGTYRYDPNGQFDWLTSKETGAANISAVDRFQYTLADGGTATVTVIINGVTDPEDRLIGDEKSNNITGAERSDMFMLAQGGDDSASGGAGNDSLFFIGALTAADVVNGGAGVDTLVLQGPYGSLTLTDNIVEIENISILGGNNINFGEPGTNRYDYVLTTHDSNFAAGVQARINGSALLAGEDFTFNGSAETDASFVVYGGKGKDTLTGGLGNDIFFYAEERFASGDTVNGGAGYDGMFLRGNYAIDFNAPGYTGLFTNIENLTLTSATDERYARGGGTEFDYNLVLSNAIVKAGQTLTVSGALLMAGETMVLDGSQETDGVLRLFGGAAADTLKGGALADLLHGAMGADTLRGGGGADVFRYQAVTESNALGRDHITDFTPGTDKIDLGAIDASRAIGGDQAFAWIGSNAFSKTAGELRAFQSGGQWIVQGDINGDGFADLVIGLTLQGPTPLGAGDFVL
jgi:VCBS repeat-containing protein